MTRIVHVDELPATPVAGVTWRPVRRELGVRAFGVNAYTADAGELLIEEHDETGDGAGGHEELYVVVTGRARFTIDDEDHEATAGTLVFLPDAGSRRSATALTDGTTALVVGGTPGEPYSVSPWEPLFTAIGLATGGDPGKAADTLSAAVEDFPGDPAVLYNAACFEARAGRTEPALAHLLAAAELAPEKVRGWAAGDADLDPLRDDPRFPA